MATFLPLLLLLLFISAAMHDDYSLTLAYLFVGVTVAGAWWGRRSLAQVQHKRQFSDHAFLGEQIQIKLHIHNRGRLPVLWLGLRDSLPVALSTTPFFQQVFSLGPGDETDFEYTVYANKRGYYPIGPLLVSSGDILGLNKPMHVENQAQYLTVYPKVIPLSTIQIPSRSPHGTLRHHQQIFEDPARVFSKRDYVAGDSLRRVDWKASAASGRLQTKLFEPTISLETLIFLDLNIETYHYRRRIEASELSITIAASLASWISGKQQTVGLRINGNDPLADDGIPPYLPPRKGKAQLMHILEILARIQTVSHPPLADLVREQRHHLSWGVTLIVVTGSADHALLDELYQARRAGQNAILILAGPPIPSASNIAQRAEHFGIPMIHIHDERDLDIWRR